MRLGVALLAAQSAHAVISKVIVADVTPASLAVVAMGDAPVVNATVRVFSDSAGTHEITSQIAPIVASAGRPGLHARGIVRVDLEDLAAETQYYLRVEIEQTTGLTTYPADGTLLSVRTAADSSPVANTGLLDLNETLRHRVYRPTLLTSEDDILVTVASSQPASAPLAEFSSARAAAPAAYFELSNLNSTSGARISLAPGTVLTLHEYAGLTCGTDAQNEVVRFRKASERTVPGRALEPRDAQACFASDTNCDGVVDVLDVQFLLNTWARHAGDCGFNPDLDLVTDGAVDVLDLQSLLNHFGENAPAQ
jgi:hypothetical protein